MRSVDFYEFVALVIPGSAFLVGVGYLFGIQKLDVLLMPQTFGSLGVHLLIAYVVGHLLQAIGNWLEQGYWQLWKGMPTDWPVTQQKDSPLAASTRSSLFELCGQASPPEGTIALEAWRALIAQARSMIYATGRADRLQFFNGNYGMFRGLLAAEGLLTVLAMWSAVDRVRFALLAVLVIALTGYRMHRFAVHYAREFFANTAELARSASRGVGGPKD